MLQVARQAPDSRLQGILNESFCLTIAYSKGVLSFEVRGERTKNFFLY